MGPIAAHLGSNVIATQIAGVYHVNQGFDTTFADSPPINLAGATTPMLSFWAWDHTEGATFDGWNLKVSTDGGQSWTTSRTRTGKSLFAIRFTGAGFAAATFFR